VSYRTNAFVPPAPPEPYDRPQRVRNATLGVMLAIIGSTCCIAETTACHATAAQVEQTFVDGLADAGCILANVFAGNVTPLGIVGACAGATEKVIVDVIDDFYAKAPAAGAVGAEWAFVTPTQKKNCDTARANAAASLAAKKSH
jgi:hypothetical protein